MKRFKEGTVIITVITCLVILTGCGGLSKMAKKADKVYWSVNPQKLELRDDSLEVEIRVTVPPKYFHKQAVIKLSPVLKYKGGEKAFASKTVQGEAVIGSNPVCSFANGGTFSTKSKIPFEYAMRNYTLVGRIEASLKGKTNVLPDQELMTGEIQVKNLNEGDRNFVISKPPQARRTKNNVVEFTKKGYAVDYMSRKKMVADQQPISIYSIPDKEMIFDGIVINNGISIKDESPNFDVYGVWTNNNGRVKGSFKIRNTANYTFTLNPKQATDLSVVVKDLDYYVPHYYNTPVSINKSATASSIIQGKTHLLTIDDTKRNKTKIEIPLSSNEAAQSYTEIKRFLMNAKRAIVSNSDYSFVGNVEPKKNGNFVDFIQKEGKRTYKYSTLKEVEIGALGADYYVKRTYNDSKVKTEKYHIVANVFSKIQWWNIDEYIKNADKIDIEYSNGDSFSGTYAVIDGKVSPQNGEYQYANGDIFNGTYMVVNDKIEPQKGTYRYQNGDVFKGDLSGAKFWETYIDGTTIFKDGKEEKNGNWLKAYNLNTTQLSMISSYKTPSEKREKAEQFLADNNYAEYVEKGDAAMRNGDLSGAKNWYNRAQTLRPEDKSVSEKMGAVDKAIKKKEFRNKLIAKYGKVKGNKLADGKLEIGMTKAMCKDGGYDESIFRVNKHKDWNGNTIEEWEYDPSKAMSAFGNEYGELAVALLQAVQSATGRSVMRETFSELKYKYIKFKNNVITELRDHSDYEDIDNSYNDIMNSLMWGF